MRPQRERYCFAAGERVGMLQDQALRRVARHEDDLVTCPGGRPRPIKIAQSYVLPYSLSREAAATSSAFGGSAKTRQVASVFSTAASGHANSKGAASTAKASTAPRQARGSHGSSTAVSAPHMLRPWQKMVDGAGGDGTRGGVRFVIFSRQRSASTTFVGLLNLHPNVTCRWESFSNSFTASKMRAFLGVANRSSQLNNIPDFMRRFWRACPSRACGFKLLNAQVRPMDKVGEVFSVAGADGAIAASPVPVRRLLLERADVHAEFASWKRAQSTGSEPIAPRTRHLSASSIDRPCVRIALGQIGAPTLRHRPSSRVARGMPKRRPRHLDVPIRVQCRT